MFRCQRWISRFAGLLAAIFLTFVSCNVFAQSGPVVDEAKAAGRTPESLIAADEDYFHDMDGGIALTQNEVRGRNNWIVWTAGNDRLWDTLSTLTFGTLDFLKTLSSHPGLKFSRDNRWSYLGLVNEPCFDRATGPDPERFGLWLDKRRAGCPPDPFENTTKYPGVKIGSRGTTVPIGSLYGYATGIVGLRLFPNPDFDAEAARKWDPERYYTDPDYYSARGLVKPYRVGMSCGFCHVGPSPVKPPADANNPQWENLSSIVGAQYFWVDRIFNWQADETSFPFQVFHTSRPGTLDTSLVSSDNINNPRTMNAVYQLLPRLTLAKRVGRETLAGGALNNRQFNEYVDSGFLTELYKAPDTVWTPHVLKDGSDSVGALGALNRVYVNIGLFSEEWLRHFNPLLGGKKVTPFEIEVARQNSSYWTANETQTPDLALFLVKSATPHLLKDAPGGAAVLAADEARLPRGKQVFADTCARCHSSKLPELPASATFANCAGPHYLECFDAYWKYTKTDDFKSKMRDIVNRDDFLDDNFLSTDARVPLTLLQTNACSPLATNGIRDNIWDNFTSDSYKDLPAVGTITVYDPFTGEAKPYRTPGGGRGYTRPASLVSLWSTAPFLLNNSVGLFDPDPSVAHRLRSFDDSIAKLLWPERRERDQVLEDKVPGTIDRTTATSYLRVPASALPEYLRVVNGPLSTLLPGIFTPDGGIEIGPIPKGTPVGLLANLGVLSDDGDPLERLSHDVEVVKLLARIKRDLLALPRNSTDEQARAVFANLAEPLMALSKCPDFVVNRGHYFGTGVGIDEPALSDDDKLSLIAFLKRF
jgi:hypothetical protein